MGGPRYECDYFHSAVNMLNSYCDFAPLSDANTIVLPSGENSGNAVNPPKLVTCSRSVPSVLINYSSNLRPSQLCLFDAKRIFLPSGVNVGAKLAQPKFVICRVCLPAASATNNSIFIGEVRLSCSKS